MTGAAPEPVSARVTVRYWAAARAAAGVDHDDLEVADGTTLADVLDRVRALHADSPKMADVVGVCTVLVGDRPMGSTDPTLVVLRHGDVIELLPPFAGG